MQDLIRSVQSVPGFKLTDTHFKIGSKIHLSDFYYAKRFFQNGYFASRFAFLLAKDITSKLEQEISENPQALSAHGLTLIGYGLYSELLISLAAKFLRRTLQLDNKTINHDVVIDTEDFGLSKGIKPNGLTVIIVPIATTFSTSLKIEEKLSESEGFKVTRFLKPHFNVLYVCDTFIKGDLSDIQKRLGWESNNHQSREVVVRSSHFSENRTQKYYLTVPSRWYAARTCSLCFPDDAVNEKALFETDKTSVTPNLIFDLPKGRFIQEEDAKRRFVLDGEIAKYGHHVRNRDHFLYSIDSEKFLEKNKPAVIQWLTELRKKFKEIVSYKETNYVVIVSPCHYSNAAFINTVNEVLFSSAANIIHYDPTSDYLENFELVYSDELSRADQVIFVDDSIKTGSTFRRMNFFIRQVTRSSGGISACVTLLNKLDRYTQNWIIELLTKSNAIFSFAHLHIYGPEAYGDKPILEKELRQYRRLEELACLDSLKGYFSNKVKKLAPRNERHLPKPKPNQVLLINVTHDVYEFFKHAWNQFSTIENFNDFKPALNSPRPGVSSRCDYISDSSTSDPLLKVLCHPPFTNYMPVRERVFEWVTSLLKETVVAIQGKKKHFSYRDLRKLKFLMRRLCLLNSNFLISSAWLEFLRQDLFDINALPRLTQRLEEEKEQFETDHSEDLLAKSGLKENERQRRNVLDFNVYYVSLVKELLMKNKIRSIVLQESIDSTSISENWQFNQIMRMLNEENTVLIQDFVDFISTNETFRELYGKGNDINESLDQIEQFLEKPQIANNIRFSLLVDFFAQCSEPPPVGHVGLKNFLWLVQYLSNDPHLKQTSLEERTEVIMSKFRTLLSDGIGTSAEHDPKPDRVAGGFLIVPDLSGTPLVTYWANEAGAYSPSNLFLTPPKTKDNSKSYFQSFMEGENDISQSYKKTIIELHKPNSQFNEWVDVYGEGNGKKVSLAEGLISANCNRVLMIRLGTRKRASDTYTGQGLLGFFYKSEELVPLNSMTVRLLLLLRSPLSNFIKKHHETNEFVELRLARQTQKLSLLTSHGQSIINNLAFFSRGPMRERFTTIALTQTLIQMRVLVGTSGGPISNVNSAEKQFEQAVSALNKPEPVNYSYFDSLKEMAEEVFRSEYIEENVSTEVNVQNAHDSNESVNSAIGTTLLDFVMFELFMNAKKNRWDFMPGDEKVKFSSDSTARNRNYLEIRIEKNSKLKICVSNTCPLIDSDTHTEIRNGNPPPKKQKDPISGSTLVKNVLQSLGGDIYYEVVGNDAATNASYFAVTVEVPIIDD